MKIVTKSNGVKTEHDIECKPITAVVHQSGIKVELLKAAEARGNEVSYSIPRKGRS